MKKSLLISALLLAVSVAAYPQQVSIKLTGGFTRIGGGDYNLGVSGQNRLLAATTAGLNGAYETLRDGLQAQLEVINFINAHLGVGLGGGYYRVSADGRATGSSGVGPDLFAFDSTYDTRVSVIPFFLNLHYTTRVWDRLSLDAFAGPVFYVVQFNFTNPRTLTLNSVQDTVTFTASKTAWGGQGGLALEYELLGGVSLVAGGFYRFGTVTDLQGNWADIGTSASGPINLSSSVFYLWYYQMIEAGTYDQLAFAGSGGPVGADVSNPRHARIDLSGLNLTAGFKFSF